MIKILERVKDQAGWVCSGCDRESDRRTIRSAAWRHDNFPFPYFCCQEHAKKGMTKGWFKLIKITPPTPEVGLINPCFFCHFCETFSDLGDLNLRLLSQKKSRGRRRNVIVCEECANESYYELEHEQDFLTGILNTENWRLKWKPEET